MFQMLGVFAEFERSMISDVLGHPQSGYPNILILIVEIFMPTPI